MKKLSPLDHLEDLDIAASEITQPESGRGGMKLHVGRISGYPATRRWLRRDGEDQEHDTQHQDTRKQPQKSVASGMEQAQKHSGTQEK